MAKVIAEKIIEAPVYEQGKQVEIKHTRIMQDASGKDVKVIDFVDVKSVEDAISQAESRKADLQAQLTECEAELAEYIVIRDAE
jgi:hypothetical protein